MQKSMHRQMGKMMRKGFVLGVRFTFRRLVGDHDITEQARYSTSAARFVGGKGQHIGRCILAAPIAVERADRCIVGQYDGKFALGGG